MNTAPWFLLLALAGAAMLIVPFLPAWNEWRRPTDFRSLPVPQGAASEVDYFARQVRERVVSGPVRTGDRLRLDIPTRHEEPVYTSGDVEAVQGSAFTSLLAFGDISLGPGSEVTQWVHADGNLTLGDASVALRRASCGGVLRLGTGVSFERLHAPTIAFGGQVFARQIERRRQVTTPFTALPNVTQRTANLFRAEGDVRLPGSCRFEGSLVVTGALSIAENTLVVGDIKARKGVVAGPGVTIDGALVCERNIHILEGSRVMGPVVSETDVWLAPGVEVGSLETPTTVTAENIMVGDGSTIHGTVWARDAGVVWTA